MKSFRFNKIKNLLNNIAFGAILFLTPLYFGFFLETDNVFELNKIALFHILVLVLLALNSYEIALFLKDFVRKNKIISILILLTLISGLLSTLFSIDPLLSWWGSADRLEGFYSQLFYLAFFLLAVFYFKKTRAKSGQNFNTVFFLASLSAFIAGVYAVLQSQGIDFFAWSESTQVRATSTFGQPNNLALFLLFGLAINFYLILNIKHKFLKIVLFIFLAIQGLAFYFTFSTAAWIALGLSALLVLALLYRSIKKLFKINKTILALGILLVLMFLFYSDFGLASKKIENLFDWQSGSTSARLQFWESAVKEIPERFWLGHGSDTQKEVLVKNYQVDWAVPSNVNVKPSRAHNIFLDTWLTRGILGLLIELAWWTYIFYLIWENWRRDQRDKLNYILLFIFISLFIYLQFNYHHVTSLVYFYLMLAVLYMHTRVEAQQGELELKARQAWIKYFKILISVLVIIASLLLINRELSSVKASHYFRELRVAAFYNQYVLAFDMYRFLKEENPNYGYYDQQFVKLVDIWNKKFDNELFYSISNEELEKIEKQIKTDNYSDILARALIYSSLSEEQEQYSGLAEAELAKLIAISPKLPASYYYQGEFYLANQKYDLAILSFEKAITLTPDLDSVGLNRTHKNAIIGERIANYQRIKKAYEEMGDEEAAFSTLVIIEELKENDK